MMYFMVRASVRAGGTVSKRTPWLGSLEMHILLSLPYMDFVIDVASKDPLYKKI